MEFSAKDHLAAVARQITKTGAMGEGLVTIHLGREWALPLADLWAALTTPDRICSWYSPVSGDLRLTKTAAGSRLGLSHTTAPDDTMASFGPGALGLGWEWSLMELDRHLNGAAPRYDEDSFAATSQGREFVRGSASLWGQADIVGGADPEQAKAAAQRTAAFFLGE